MAAQPEQYPALYLIFTLLNAIRRGVGRTNMWREFRRQRIALRPRLAFWIALCKEAGLVEEFETKLRVSRQARRWLGLSGEEQALRLLDAWQNAPGDRKARQLRRKLVWKLRFDAPLARRDLGSIRGLEALGFYASGKLTRWGRLFIKGEGVPPTPATPAPCLIHHDHFVASLPHHLDLLWELERYVRPACPGRYPLSGRAVRFLNGDPHDLIALLERGLGGALPGELRARLLNQPSLHVLEGVVLEFSHPEQLRQLLRQPAFRRHFEQLLSPRHVLLSRDESTVVLQMLRRRGALPLPGEEPFERETKRTKFHRAPALQPVGKDIPKLEILNEYLHLQQALDVTYRAPGYPAESRRITPLLIEQRGEQTYVMAYCHTRRGQRTFRLDRMDIPGTY